MSTQALVWKPLPSLVFGILCTISGLLYVLLPETLGQLLPDTVEQAERFGRRSRRENRQVTYKHCRVVHFRVYAYSFRSVWELLARKTGKLLAQIDQSHPVILFIRA